MSLARALTRRMAKRDDNDGVGRSKTVRYAAGSIRRDMISLPTELISTTNVQALTAPDISSLNLNKSILSSGSSISSHNDSDFSSSFDKSFLTDTTDSSSIETSTPATPVTPPMGHTLDFFSVKDITEPLKIFDAVPDVPAVPTLPQRAPSHSKKAHVELSRKRSIQRLSPPPSSIPEKPRNSADFFGSAEVHPFGKELAKVNEVAEEFGAAHTVMDEEEQEILGKGFHKFSVDDYINELVGLYGGVYDNKLGPIGNPFI